MARKHLNKMFIILSSQGNTDQNCLYQENAD